MITAVKLAVAICEASAKMALRAIESLRGASTLTRSSSETAILRNCGYPPSEENGGRPAAHTPASHDGALSNQAVAPAPNRLSMHVPAIDRRPPHNEKPQSEQAKNHQERHLTGGHRLAHAHDSTDRVEARQSSSWWGVAVSEPLGDHTPSVVRPQHLDER